MMAYESKVGRISLGNVTLCSGRILGPVLSVVILFWSSWVSAALCPGVPLKAVAPAPGKISQQVHELSTVAAPVGTGSDATDLIGGRHSSVTLLCDGTFTGSGSNTQPAEISSQGRKTTTQKINGKVEIVKPGSVKSLTSYGNRRYYGPNPPKNLSAWVDAHLASGEAAFGNNGSNDINYATGSHKANSGHNGMEGIVKFTKDAIAGRYHNNRADQSRFIATEVNDTNIAYKPIIHYEMITSSMSVFEFEANNPARPLVGLDALSDVTDAENETFLRSVPAYFDMKITFYMDQWVLENGTWSRSEVIKKMPREVADEIFLPMKNNSGTKLKFATNSERPLKYPTVYTYTGEGPRIAKRVWNWGPEEPAVKALYPAIDSKKAVEPPWAQTHLLANPIN